MKCKKPLISMITKIIIIVPQSLYSGAIKRTSVRYDTIARKISIPVKGFINAFVS